MRGKYSSSHPFHPIILLISVKISFLELYNEEIFDLLSGIDDTSKLRLYEDAYKKGSVIIQVTANFAEC